MAHTAPRLPLPAILQQSTGPSGTSRRLRSRFARGMRTVTMANECISSINFLAAGGSPPAGACVSVTQQEPGGYPFSPWLQAEIQQSFEPDTGQNSTVTKSQERAHAFVYEQAARLSRCQPSGSCGGVTKDPYSHSGDVSVPLAAFLSSDSAYVTPERAVDIAAELVSLPSGAGVVDLSATLPESLKIQLCSARAMLRDTSAGDLPAKRVGRVDVHATRPEYVKLIRRMHAKDMLGFTKTPRVVNGIFAVPKDGDAQRLIIDARAANAEFKDPPHVVLPTPDKLAAVRAESGRHFFAAKVDLDNFYHRMILPAWIQPFFALPTVRADEVGVDVARAFGPSAWVFPMCRTMPMGWSWSVFLAQAAHLHIIEKSVSSMNAEDRIGVATDLVLRRGRVLHAVYIDDVILLGDDATAVKAVQERYVKAVAEAGFVVKQSKTIAPSSTGVECLGLLVDGRKHTVGVAPGKLLTLKRDTERLIAKGYASGREVAALVGRWVWAALVRRPILAALQNVYRFIECARGRSFALWPSVARELRVLSGLAPLMIAVLSAPRHGTVVATDASMTGMGVTACRAADLPVDLPSRPDGGNRDDVAVGQEVAHLRWRTIVACQWRYKEPEHINSYELRAADTGVRWLLSSPHSQRSRLTILTDSAVAAGALSKGRSSSPIILRRLRRISALLLASGCVLDVCFVRSEFNPADAPSRGAAVARRC
jgi:hypothetical protein